MKKLIIVVFAFLSSANVFADCSAFALHGDWTVFYRDNAAPDSVITPGSVFEIRYNKEHDQFTVLLQDENYVAVKNSWTSGCVGAAVTLSGVLQDKRASENLEIEIRRITNASELVSRSNNVKKLDQISIRVTDYIGLADNKTTALPAFAAPDPGHAHADR